MTHQEVRQKFIDFSVAKGHTLLPPSPLVPTDNDPSVLFTIAGMQQFKSYYGHPNDAPAKRIVTIQHCVRTNDIDEVGDDTHNTLFEMLGHFSFGYTGHVRPDGPYFKRQSLHFGWEFLTKELGVEPERIHATYFAGDAQRPRDEESRQILEEIDGLGLVEASNENFWGPVGDEGPCGPNTEFYIDGVEVWNSVFNEYTKDKDGSYVSLVYKGVDMGTGFERLLAAIQGVPSVYGTDLVAPFLDFVESQSAQHEERRSRIIVDHTKAALFLLTDGVRPGNKGRDYILRRLIRRASREAKQIGFNDFSGLLAMYVKVFHPFYPLLSQQHAQANELFEAERAKFLKTLEAGTKQLQQIIATDDRGEISGEQAFKLFDTFGFPVELTQEMASEKGWSVDLTGFEHLFSKHKEQSRAGIEKIFKGGLADDAPQTVAHHTAHHLLLAALRQILGSHVVQRGSNVTSDRLRIDISHPDKISDDQLRLAEDLVNQKIAEDLPVINEEMERDKALSMGALAEFGAKYPEKVSVYSIVDQNGDAFSRELCGGPHVSHTGELGRFEILKEEASGAGVRRIRARVTPKAE